MTRPARVLPPLAPPTLARKRLSPAVVEQRAARLGRRHVLRRPLLVQPHAVHRGLAGAAGGPGELAGAPPAARGAQVNGHHPAARRRAHASGGGRFRAGLEGRHAQAGAASGGARRQRRTNARGGERRAHLDCFGSVCSRWLLLAHHALRHAAMVANWSCLTVPKHAWIKSTRALATHALSPYAPARAQQSAAHHDAPQRQGHSGQHHAARRRHRTIAEHACRDHQARPHAAGPPLCACGQSRRLSHRAARAGAPAPQAAAAAPAASRACRLLCRQGRAAPALRGHRLWRARQRLGGARRGDGRGGCGQQQQQQQQPHRQQRASGQRSQDEDCAALPAGARGAGPPGVSVIVFSSCPCARSGSRSCMGTPAEHCAHAHTPTTRTCRPPKVVAWGDEALTVRTACLPPLQRASCPLHPPRARPHLHLEPFRALCRRWRAWARRRPRAAPRPPPATWAPFTWPRGSRRPCMRAQRGP